VEKNGFCPEWDETFEFNITESSTACLYFSKSYLTAYMVVLVLIFIFL
jgi:hypothetical protein